MARGAIMYNEAWGVDGLAGERVVEEQLLETWQIHCRINQYVLTAVDPAALMAKPPKGRTVGQMFAHIHNVRLMWLQSAAPEQAAALRKLGKDDPLDHDTLRVALETSGTAIETLLRESLISGRVKGFKPHPAAFLGYLLTHEGYHHGEIGIVLAQVGYPLDKKTAFGMWEWGVR